MKQLKAVAGRADNTKCWIGTLAITTIQPTVPAHDAAVPLYPRWSKRDDRTGTNAMTAIVVFNIRDFGAVGDA